MMRGLQEEVAEKIDAGLRAAPAKEGGRVYDEPSPSATPRAATWSAPLTQAGLPAAHARPRSRAGALNRGQHAATLPATPSWIVSPRGSVATVNPGGAGSTPRSAMPMIEIRACGTG